MSSQAALGAKALEDRDYPTAIEQLTKALATNTSNPSPLWLIQRSTAYQRSAQYELALADADAALHAAKSRARREFIATAHFRRAVALHGLKRFGDARLCLNWCRKSNEKEKGLGIWQAKVKNDFDKAEKELGPDATEVRTTVKEIPDKVEEKAKEKSAPLAPAAQTPAPPAVTSKEKIRHEWYQSPSSVTITIFAKGVPKDKAEVMIGEQSVSLPTYILFNTTSYNFKLEVSFPIGTTEQTYALDFSPLFAKIKPAESSYNIFSTKVEIILQKATPGRKWSNIEGDESTLKDSSNEPLDNVMQAKTGDKGPVYPTSSRTGPKDWDKIDDADEGEDQDVNSFFQKLYKDADPDTRKAMMKSYQESNGTSLSTNWADVQKAPVPTQPPEGVEAKKWGS
ncbi:hypothetical protein BP5796_06225 [Coleophoma crateriformis]|uniref:SGS-domain-containing protein n=1 Tax=Coleophoma crateriformis TaxID=565419 RepID=A0A3D8RWD9_9HELO|nr:hypothetical protein BP5796_06225 [Coleophoma crateriformis]